MKNSYLILTTAVLCCFYSLTNASVIDVGPSLTYTNISAAAAVAHAGDTIYIHAGSYAGYQGVSALQGNASQWITIKRYNNDVVNIAGGWQFSSCSYIKFENLTFKATPANPGTLINIDNGGNCASLSRHINIDSCYFLDETDATAICVCKFGGVDSFEVKNCVIKNGATEGWAFNIATNGTISGCLFENLTGGGFHCKLGSENITIERNTFKNCSNNALELGGSSGNFFCSNATAEAKNIHVYSNVFDRCTRGLSFNSCVNCDAVNNTFYQCSSSTIRFALDSPLFPVMSGNIIKNNIFAFGTAADFFGYLPGPANFPANTATFTNNIYYSTTNPNFNLASVYFDSPGWDLIKEQNPIVYTSASTIFVNEVNSDFHLVAGSPAIAAGTAVSSPSVDYYGYLFKPTRSVGASEYGSTLTGLNSLEIKNPLLTIFPNPCNNKTVTITCQNESFNNSTYNLKLYSLTGELIMTKNVSQLPEQLNISGLAKGVYSIQLKSEKEMYVQKLIVD